MSYAFPITIRIYAFILLCLCSALFSVSALASYARTPVGLSPTVKTAINNGLSVESFVRSGVAQGGNGYVFAPKSSTVNYNSPTSQSSGALRVVQNINTSAARRVAGSVLRGGFYGGVIIAGIDALIDDYQSYKIEQNEGLSQRDIPTSDERPPNADGVSSCSAAGVDASSRSEAESLLRVECSKYGQVLYLNAIQYTAGKYTVQSSGYCPYTKGTNRYLTSSGGNSAASGFCEYATSPKEYTYKAATQTDRNIFEKKYNPAASDFDALDIYLSMGDENGNEFDLTGVELSEPEVTKQPSSTTETVQSGNSTTVTTTQPSLSLQIGSEQGTLELSLSVTETVDNYDGANLTSSNTTTTTKTSSDKASYPQVATGGGSGSSPDSPPFDFELPSFCEWAVAVCDWFGWTQEPLDEDDPVFADLIENQEDVIEDYDFNFSASAQCPQPISINLPVVNKSVEIKYDLLCSYVEMINPIIITAAWILAAFIYLGVLRRG